MNKINKIGVPETHGVEYILKHTPLDGVKSLLDIGLGNGLATNYFVSKGVKVTGLGLNLESYGIDMADYKKRGIKLIEKNFFDFEGEAGSFDAVWAAHILEHVLDSGVFLKKIHKLLSKDGWLFVVVPPYKTKIVGGHVVTGWTLGQLTYVLLLAGFDSKNGHFVQYGYNLCAFVRKSNKVLPRVNYDKGDLEILEDFFPTELNAKQGFEGDLYSINWPHAFDKKEIAYRRSKRLSKLLNEIKKYFGK